MKTGAYMIALVLLLSLGGVQAQAVTDSGSNGFVAVVKKVGENGLSLFRAVLFVFLMIYAVFLGIGVAFGQAGAQEIASFVVGSLFAGGAQLLAGIYIAILG